MTVPIHPHPYPSPCMSVPIAHRGYRRGREESFKRDGGSYAPPIPLGFLSPLSAYAHTGLGTHRGGEGGKGGEAGGKVDGGCHE